ncbi:hypothetical protein pb186bvf_014323 [Paramecium bursaria]
MLSNQLFKFKRIIFQQKLSNLFKKYIFEQSNFKFYCQFSLNPNFKCTDKFDFNQVFLCTLKNFNELTNFNVYKVYNVPKIDINENEYIFILVQQYRFIYFIFDFVLFL